MSALGELYAETKKPEKPVLLMLDEFAQLGPIKSLSSHVRVAREYAFKFWFILQDLQSLKELYPDWESFLGSAGAVQGLEFTLNDMTTARYFSERSGLKTEYRKSYVRSGGTTESPGGGSTNTGWSESTQETETALYSVHDLCSFTKNQQILICPNMAWGLVLDRFPYFEGKRYEHCYEPDPWHMSDAERAAFEERARRGLWHVNNLSYAECWAQ